MRARFLPLLLFFQLSAALRTGNFASSNIFEIFVETNEISNGTMVEGRADTEAVKAGPPPHDQTARMARYVCHQSNWGAMATISARTPTVGFPFANVFSLSDGPIGESTGTPYIYATPMEISFHDLRPNPQASITMSLAEGNYCTEKHYDPMDPRCAHIILTGNMVSVPKDSEEGEFAKRALFSRHPVMPDWPKNHGWFFTKLNITNVIVLDFFGGAITVPLEDYFNATVDPILDM